MRSTTVVLIGADLLRKDWLRAQKRAVPGTVQSSTLPTEPCWGHQRRETVARYDVRITGEDSEAQL
jgi:hypothetical protein